MPQKILRELIEKENLQEIEVSLIQFNDKAERLFTLDNKINEVIYEVITEEREIDVEIENKEAYRDRYFKIQFEANNKLKISQDEQFSRASSKCKRHLKLPKLELRKFDGSLCNWIKFWSQFKQIHEDEDIEGEHKFQYLIQATEEKSSARELVESFPPSAENYYKAVEQLKQRFGRDELLIEYYVRELLNLVLEKQKHNTKPLRELYDKLEAKLRSLETLGVTKEKYECMLTPLAESALPDQILREWERKRCNSQNISMENLLAFLTNEVEGEERLQLVKTFVKEEPTALKKMSSERCKNRPTAAGLICQDTNKQCVFCGLGHSSEKCLQAAKLNMEERRKVLQASKRCFGCTRPGHMAKNCKERCVHCRGKHVPIMCWKVKKVDSVEGKDVKQASRSLELSGNTGDGELFLQTLVICVNNKLMRALLDTGSQRSYLLNRSVKKLNLNPVGEEILHHGLFGGTKTRLIKHEIYRVELQKNRDRSFKIQADLLGQDKICDYIPRFTNKELLKKYDINFCDYGTGSEVEILLGVDILSQIWMDEVRKMDKGLTALRTRLGWTLMGRGGTSRTQNNLVIDLFNDTNPSIEDLWSLEVIGIEDPIKDKSKREKELEAVTHFNRTFARMENGRYEVRLPWKENVNLPTNNRIQAERRLETLTKKLQRMGQYEEYKKVLQGWLDAGIIEICRNSVENSYYLPHSAVVKEKSLTTRIRPVFDASAEDVNGISLNDALWKGPNLIELIPPLLLRFRLRAVGGVADVEKAFLQISINPEDRDHLKFLWNNQEGSIIVLKHTRVIFGARCSPFLLAMVLNHIFEKAPTRYTATAQILKESMYVDNCVVSLDTLAELQNFKREAQELFEEGRMNLRGWYDNVNVAASIPVLGMLWDTARDTLSCTFEMTKLAGKPLTKRGLLSAANNIFDPVGFTAPATLIPKLLLKEAWASNQRWDEALPDSIVQRFEKWFNQIDCLKECYVDRHVKWATGLHRSLHVFADASKEAYAACIFLRVERNSEVQVELLSAKARVAPKAATTIPRMELLAALIASRLYLCVKNAIGEDITTHFWTDSTVVLAWIQRKENWATFVENRVREIRTNCDQFIWRHLPGTHNPADLLSRGCLPAALENSRWWEGPAWLRKIPSEWPNEEVVTDVEAINRERRKMVVTAVCADSRILKEFERFSSFEKMIRVIGWILRFKYNSQCKRGKIEGELHLEEVEQAQDRLLQLVQQEAFALGLKDDHLVKFQAFKDDSGVICLKTKIIERPDCQQFRTPAILPSSHHVVLRLIQGEHIKAGHCGINTLLAILREKYWIIRGRQTVRKVLRRCVVCKRFQGRPLGTFTAPLPISRVKDAFVFENTGVDFAGPLYLKNGQKVWIVLFTCAVYRAIHLELVGSLSTETFLLALRRFIARRGRPRIIFSDNGTNFRGSDAAFRRLDWIQIERYSTAKRIKWSFIPPSAAWWGGFWERMVGTMKLVLKKTLGRASLTEEELHSLICEAESLVNSRPLTYISEDNKDPEPITPARFLQDLKLAEVPECDELETKSLNRKLRYRQQLKQELRRRFRNEYLGQLLLKTGRSTRAPTVGEVVLVGTDNLKRQNWPMGRILETIPGRDGQIRVVRVKTTSGEMMRTIQQIYPLEVCDTFEQQDGDTIPLPDLHSERKLDRSRHGREIHPPKRLNL